MSHYILTIVGATEVAQDIHAHSYESEMLDDGSLDIDFLNSDGEIIAEVHVSARHSAIVKFVE